MTDASRRTRTGVLSIVLAYASVSGLWILLSDRAIGTLFHDPESLVQASMVKGWFFVAVTTLLLYVLVRRFARVLLASQEHEIALELERKQPPPMLVAIADASSDAIFAKDEQGRYLLFNNAAARFVGRPADEVIGKDDRALFPPAQAEELMSIDRRIRATGIAESNEEVLPTPEGERVFLGLKGPLRGADGHVFGTYGVSRDITERKRSETRLHDSEARLRLLVDFVPAALAMFDADMRYLEASRRWRDDYVRGDAQVIGRLHREMPADGADGWTAAHRRAMAGETVAVDEDRVDRRDGSAGWLRWQVRPWFRSDGSIGGSVIFSEDITQRKIAEREIVQRNQELEHFNRAATGRELRMIALKRQVNELARAAGRPAPYDVSFADAAGERPGP